MAVGALNYGHHDLTHPLQDGHPWGLCPRVGAEEQLSCPSTPSPGTQEEPDLHTSPGFAPFPVGGDRGRGRGDQQWADRTPERAPWRWLDLNTGWGGEESEGGR